MPKRLDHVEAAKAEAERLGATIKIGYCMKHIVGVISISGKQRKIFMSKSTANKNVCHIVKLDVRNKVREMTA